MNDVEKKIILTLAENGALNLYQIEKKANIKHATAYNSIKRLEQDGFVKIISETTFKTGLKSKRYCLSFPAGVMQAYALGAEVKTLKILFDEIAENKLDEAKKKDIEDFFAFLRETPRKDIDLLLSCWDFSTTPPKLKEIPVPLESLESFSRIFAIMLKHNPFKREIKRELKKLLEALESS